MLYEVKKEYKEVEKSYPSPVKDGHKTYMVKVLVFNRDEAFSRAYIKAEKEKYASVSLIRENDLVWVFEFYNKLLINERKKV